MDKGIAAISTPSFLRECLQIPNETRIVCAGTAAQLKGGKAHIGLLQDGTIQAGPLKAENAEKTTAALFSTFIHDDERVQTSLLPSRYYYKEKSSSYPYSTRGAVKATQHDLDFNNEVDEACESLGLIAMKGPSWTSIHKLECEDTSALTTRGYQIVEMEDAYIKAKDERLLILTDPWPCGEVGTKWLWNWPWTRNCSTTAAPTLCPRRTTRPAWSAGTPASHCLKSPQGQCL